MSYQPIIGCKIIRHTQSLLAKPDLVKNNNNLTLTLGSKIINNSFELSFKAFFQNKQIIGWSKDKKKNVHYLQALR